MKTDKSHTAFPVPTGGVTGLGLTKFEYTTIEVFKQILADPVLYGLTKPVNGRAVAKKAISYSIDLFTELEKTNF